MENVETLMATHHSSLSLWSNCQPNLQQFHRQLQELQYTYNPQFEQILEKRRQIVDGSCEPTEIDCSNLSIEILTKNTLDSLKNQSNLQSALSEKGIPNFWQIVLKNLDSYDYPIQSRDELCLKYLTDIRCILNPPNCQMTSFVLEFHFLPSNPFFIQTILTKYYSIRLELDDLNPYRSYDGPEVDSCHGCIITWKSDHNLTIRKHTKRIRNKKSGQIRFEQHEERVKSFFDFFSPPIIPANGIDEMPDEEQIRLEADIEFGLLLKQRILPKAILYYTGEALPVSTREHDNDELTSSDSSQ